MAAPSCWLRALAKLLRVSNHVAERVMPVGMNTKNQFFLSCFFGFFFHLFFFLLMFLISPHVKTWCLDWKYCWNLPAFFLAQRGKLLWIKERQQLWSSYWFIGKNAKPRNLTMMNEGYLWTWPWYTCLKHKIMKLNVLSVCREQGAFGQVNFLFSSVKWR